MMNDVNLLWVSPWRELHKTLAGSVGTLRSAESLSKSGTSTPGEAPPPRSWLFRARAAEHPYHG